MLLYQGSPFVKGNKFIDPKGSILTFDKATKKGKLFVTQYNRRVGLTEKQVNNLKLMESDIYHSVYREYKIVGISISFDDVEDKLLITSHSLMSFNVFDNPFENNEILGYLCFNISNITLGHFTLDFLTGYNNSGNIKVIFDGLDSIVYELDFISSFSKIEDNLYMCVFKGVKAN